MISKRETGLVYQSMELKARRCTCHCRSQSWRKSDAGVRLLFFSSPFFFSFSFPLSLFLYSSFFFIFTRYKGNVGRIVDYFNQQTTAESNELKVKCCTCILSKSVVKEIECTCSVAIFPLSCFLFSSSSCISFFLFNSSFMYCFVLFTPYKGSV